MVTWRSSIDSSRAAWVLGEARLISSPTTMLAKIDPGLNSKSPHRAVDRPGQRLGQHRLADPGDVLDQDVPLGEQGDEGQADDLGFALDDALDIGPDLVEGGGQIVHTADIGPGGGHRTGSFP